MTPVVRRVRNWVYAPVDGVCVALFRVIFGVLMVYGEAIRHQIQYQEVDYRFRTSPVLISHYLFRISPLPDYFPPEGRGLDVYWWIMSGAAATLTLGIYTKTSAALFCILYSIAFFAEQTSYNNHYYLICMISAAFACIDSDAILSWQKKPLPSSPSPGIPRWHRGIFQFLMVIVYTYGGIAKLNKDWLRGEPMRSALTLEPAWMDVPIVREPVLMFLCYGGLLFDLFVAFGLLYRPTRVLCVPMVLYFHTMNFFMFTIGVFPFMAAGSTLVFFEGHEVAAGISLVSELVPILSVRALLLRVSRMLRSASYVSPPPGRRSKSSFRKKKRGRRVNRRELLVLSALAIFVAFQVLFPLRHFVLNSGSGHAVHWNEIGHKFSWHMKLRAKRCSGSFYFGLPDGTRREIHLANYLTPKQRTRVLDNPDATWIFARFMKDKLDGNPPIYADIKCGLNGREPVPFTDPEVDIAASEEELSFFGSPPFILDDYGPLDYSSWLFTLDVLTLCVGAVGVVGLGVAFRVLFPFKYASLVRERMEFDRMWVV